MRPEVVPLLQCVSCGGDELASRAFVTGSEGEIRDGVVWCCRCRVWYPVEDGLLDLLVGEIGYPADRLRFAATWRQYLAGLDLAAPATPGASGGRELQRIQQQHFDWYASNDAQSYDRYENTPFWRAADRLAFDSWRQEVAPGARLLDVGCAQGRSVARLLDLDIDVVAFDVAKLLVRRAIERCRRQAHRARVSFLAADATRFPFHDSAFDHVLAYGVLHHLPDAAAACREIARVLRPGGLYLGSENNRTPLRGAFDALQRLRPLWHERAGPSPLISAADLERWFAPTDVTVTTRASVFVPPHWINALPPARGYRVLALFDRLVRWRVAGPVARWGGLLLVRGVKRRAVAAG